MRLETIEKANKLIEAKKKLENEIKRITISLDPESKRPITRLDATYEGSDQFFIRDREFITQVCTLWKQKLEVQLTKINLELMAL